MLILNALQTIFGALGELILFLLIVADALAGIGLAIGLVIGIIFGISYIFLKVFWLILNIPTYIKSKNKKR